MAIVEYKGGPWTHKYLMGKNKDWLADEVLRLNQLLEENKQLRIQDLSVPPHSNIHLCP